MLIFSPIVAKSEQRRGILKARAATTGHYSVGLDGCAVIIDI
jgi:hypothetical protein